VPKPCRRGEIYLVDLNPVKGHVQGGHRPAVIIQNDTGNRYSSTTIIAPLTTSFRERVYPTEVRVPAGEGGLHEPSSILLNQIKAVDKDRLERLIGQLGASRMGQVDQALKLSLGLDD
jgi:mRNA interferase MazF